MAKKTSAKKASAKKASAKKASAKKASAKKASINVNSQIDERTQHAIDISIDADIALEKMMGNHLSFLPKEIQ